MNVAIGGSIQVGPSSWGLRELIYVGAERSDEPTVELPERDIRR